MARHQRRGTRPRYRRMVAAAAAVLVTLVAVLGGIGVLPLGSGNQAANAVTPQQVAGVRSSLPRGVDARAAAGPASKDLPEHSGRGRRIVFDMSAQRVWLVSGRDAVRRTYPVSGSLTDNLDAGAYRVYSKSRWAVGVDDSGVMQYMVRFAHGAHAAIGFHDIPVHLGHKLQTVSELGTPQSHGCIRQQRKDAKALWHFAPVDTLVVVLA